MYSFACIPFPLAKSFLQFFHSINQVVVIVVVSLTVIKMRIWMCESFIPLFMVLNVVVAQDSDRLQTYKEPSTFFALTLDCKIYVSTGTAEDFITQLDRAPE